MNNYLTRIHKTTLVALIGLLLSLLLPIMTVNAKETIKVGVLQYVEHDSLSATYEGFVAGLEEAGYKDGDNLTIHFLNASGDNANMQTMTEALGNNNDYLFAIATPAAQALANKVKNKPVYFSAVSDPVGAGLVKSLEKPGTNVTGTIDAGPIKEQVELLVNIIPNVKRVGILYNSGETNSISEAKKAREIMEEKGIEVEEATVTSTNDVSQIVQSVLKKDIDALYTVTDNTIASSMTLVGDLAIDAKIPLIGGSKDMILENGLATFGLDYFELGKQTAQMLVNQIEKDLKTEEIPVESAKNLELVINEKVAEKLGIDPKSIQAP